VRALCFGWGVTIQLRKSVQPIRTVDLDQYVSSDTTVWPAGQTILQITFTDTGGYLPAYGVLRCDYDPAVLTALRITQVSYRRKERISGTGIAASDFATFSGTPSPTLFPYPKGSYALVITLAVNTAPLANEDVVFHLRPPDNLPTAFGQAARVAATPRVRQVLRRTLPRAVRRAVQKRKPGFWDRLKSAGRGIYRRLPFVAGVGSLSDGVAGELLAGLGEADSQWEQVGAAALDEVLLGIGDELEMDLEGPLGEEIADDVVGDLVDVLGAAWRDGVPGTDWHEGDE
jgi:hypothetical protein